MIDKWNDYKKMHFDDITFKSKIFSHFQPQLLFTFCLLMLVSSKFKSKRYSSNNVGSFGFILFLLGESIISLSAEKNV